MILQSLSLNIKERANNILLRMELILEFEVLSLKLSIFLSPVKLLSFGKGHEMKVNSAGFLYSLIQPSLDKAVPFTLAISDKALQ
jgi:hypothetical protein